MIKKYIKKFTSIFLVFLIVIGISSKSIYAAGNRAYTFGQLFNNADTSYIAKQAAEIYNSIGMTATAYTKPTYDILSGKTKYGNIRMQGDILLFAGHGNSNSVSFKSTGVYNTSNASKTVNGKTYVGLTKNNMSKVKLAIFAGCETAKNKDSNLPKTAVANGAKTAIGWNKTVAWVSLKSWMKNFNSNLANGQTVINAAINANKKNYMDNNVKSLTIYGNENLTIK